jgi:hypothetical protein
VVPVVLFEYPEMIKFNPPGAQMSVLPGLAKPPAGLVPKKILYFFIPIQPVEPVIVRVKVC